ncbi:MAG TPA: hypothetical protein VFS88_06090 [Micavibrio sp.]|nr:hypothetical protein [Micavibrio sp.]
MATKRTDKWGNPIEDDFEIQNRTYYGDRIRLMEAFKRAMQTRFNAYITYVTDLDYGVEGNKNEKVMVPSVFLTKLITGSQMATAHFPDGKTVPAIVNSFDHIRISYYEADTGDEKRKVQTFSASNLMTSADLMGKSEDDAKRAIYEMVAAGFLLVQHAKAAGWNEINFGNTTDPVKRFILALACKNLNISYASERVSERDLPPGTELDQSEKLTISLQIRAAVNDIMKEGYLYLEPQDNQPPKKRQEPQPKAA